MDLEATALPTEPQPLHRFSLIVALSTYYVQASRVDFKKYDALEWYQMLE